MQSHVFLMALFAACVAVVGGTLLKDSPKEQLRTGGAIFASLVGGALVLAWVLYVFPL